MQPLTRIGKSLARYLDTYDGRHDLYWLLVPWCLAITGMLAVL